MSKSNAEKYVEVLEECNQWVTKPEWAKAYAEKYPDKLKKAEEQGSKREPSRKGVVILATNISSSLSGLKRKYAIEEDDSGSMKKFRIGSKEIAKENLLKDIEEELESEEIAITRQSIIKRDTALFTSYDVFRYKEFLEIQKSFKILFKVDFEIDHAHALMNVELPGQHHPNNLQLLNSRFNSIKGKSNWKRFTIEKQIDHINECVSPYLKFKEQLNIEANQHHLDALIERLKIIYE